MNSQFLKAAIKLNDFVGGLSCDDADEDYDRGALYCTVKDMIEDYKYNAPPKVSFSVFLDHLKQELYFTEPLFMRSEKTKMVAQKIHDEFKAALKLVK